MFNRVRASVKSGLANTSFVLAQLGGFAAGVSMIGGWITKLLEIGPWWTPAVAWGVLVIMCIGDWAEDSIPNRVAVYTAMAWPSALVATISGECGSKAFGGIGSLLAKWGWITTKTADIWRENVKDWVHVGSDAKAGLTLISIVFIVMAATYAHRYATKSRAGASTGATPIIASGAGNKRR